MKTLMKLTIPATVLCAAFLFNTTATFAKKEYAAKEKKTCVYCHVKAGAKDLNDNGKYYKDHNHSLEGLVEKK